MDDATLRAWWSHKQGLDGSAAGQSASEILLRTGWVRSAGGVAPYLALFARGGWSREDVDACVADLRIHELPSARGCTYVLPSDDFALGLRVGRGFSDVAEVKTAAKVGVTEAELRKLSEKVLKELGKGPRDPAELREAAGARSLGEEGRKVGISTPLPVVLGMLQQIGKIRRVPGNGRLDQQSYRYALWNLPEWNGSAEAAYTELARRYFRWTGPATLKEFQWFSGLGVKVSQAAVAPLKLVDVGGGRWIDPAERDEFERFKRPQEPAYSLVSSLDGIALLRRDLLSLSAHAGAVSAVGGLGDLPSHAILDRGELIGLWEYDPAGSAIVWMSFGKAGKGLRAAVGKTEAFVRDRLGDARSMSLDTPKSRQARLEKIRKAAAGI
jgi:hypothetical protein